MFDDDDDVEEELGEAVTLLEVAGAEDEFDGAAALDDVALLEVAGAGAEDEFDEAVLLDDVVLLEVDGAGAEDEFDGAVVLVDDVAVLFDEETCGAEGVAAGVGASAYTTEVGATINMKRRTTVVARRMPNFPIEERLSKINNPSVKKARVSITL